jgi:hypothetical protein
LWTEDCTWAVQKLKAVTVPVDRASAWGQDDLQAQVLSPSYPLVVATI